MLTNQMKADLLLEEHRAVMAALVMSCIKRPTEEQYEAELNLLREEMHLEYGDFYILPSSSLPASS